MSGTLGFRQFNSDISYYNCRAESLKHVESQHASTMEEGEEEGLSSPGKKGKDNQAQQHDHGQQGVEHKCTDCEKVFRRKEYLRLHHCIREYILREAVHVLGLQIVGWYY
jgi:hypothetical protein